MAPGRLFLEASRSGWRSNRQVMAGRRYELGQREELNMTQTNQTKQLENDSSNVVEDLTLDENKSENVKGGGFLLMANYQIGSAGVEREMKESGEKGGTE